MKQKQKSKTGKGRKRTAPITHGDAEPKTESIKAFARRRLKDPTYLEVIFKIGKVGHRGVVTAFQDIDMNGPGAEQSLPRMARDLKEKGHDGNYVVRRDNETREAFKQRAAKELGSGGVIVSRHPQLPIAVGVIKK
jgi:hypothetical protein